MDEETLEHYGVKGMKWGVRKNYVKLDNYKGKTYFISEVNMGGKTLTPRVPSNYFTKNGYEDSATERISFAPSVKNALMGLSQNVTGKKFYVHEPVGRHDIYKPNSKAVPDSDITGELWIKDPVELKVVGEITATGDSGKPGKSFNYGSNTAELYEFNYEWISKPGGDNVTNDELLEHHGVKGMKWGVRKAAKKYKSSRAKSKARKAKSRIEEDEMRKAAKAKIIERIDENGNFTRTVRPTATDSKKREKEWKKIYKNRGNLSDAEIQNTLKRLKWENELQKAANSASEEQRKAAQAKIDLAIKLIGAIPIQTDDGKTTNVKDWAAGALTGAIKDAAGKKVKHSDTLEHYGVKGMKWKFKGAAEQEPHEDKVGAGGSGLVDDQNEDEEEEETSPTPKKKWQPKDKTIDGHAPWVKAQPNPKSKIKKFEKTPIPKSKKLPTAGNGQDKKMDIRYLDQYKKYNKVPKL